MENYKKLLEQDIEIALEEFEEATKIKITGITFKRIETDAAQTGKSFEYVVNVWTPTENT